MPFSHPLVQFIKDQPPDLIQRLKTQAGRRSPPHLAVSAIRSAVQRPPQQINPRAAYGAIVAAAAKGNRVDVELHVLEPKSGAYDQDWSRSERLFISAQFSPAEFERGFKVNWAELKPVGVAHPRLHYTGTDVQTMKFSLYMDALAVFKAPGEPPERGLNLDGTRPLGSLGLDLERGIADLADRMAFLEAVCYAPKDGSPGAGSPPRLMFAWPNFVSMTCVLAELAFKVTRWAPSGHALQVTADLTLKEVRNVRLSMDIVRKSGGKHADDSGKPVT